MKENTDLVWNGERNRQLRVYRPCPCNICSKNRKGVGYLSFSDTEGRGFTIWLENENVYRRLRSALRHLRNDRPNDRPESVAREDRPVGRYPHATLKRTSL